MATRLETGADCGQGLKLDGGILLSPARAWNYTLSWNSSIPAVLSFTTDLIGKKMEDGRLRFVSAFLILLRYERSSPFSFFFLFPVRRGICSPFPSTIFLVLLAQVSSAAILFAENRHTKQFFSPRKKVFVDFFSPEVEKPCSDISRENENCEFPQKCGKMEALLITLDGRWTADQIWSVRSPPLLRPETTILQNINQANCFTKFYSSNQWIIFLA